MIQYRADIDGLRAIAVLSVVLFHAGISGLDGGYTGVDIFFVISGYLITFTLCSDLEQKRFSLAEFYKRRILRILPVLCTALIAVIGVSLMVAMPDELDLLGKSVLSTTLFVSNIFYWSESDYFASESENNPLLHTWSLAVEEQFYIVFPIILMMIYRYKISKPIIVVIGLCIISFLLCIVATPLKPAASFYWLPTRFWEMGIGAILAMYTSNHLKGNKNIMSIIGLLLIVYGIVALDKDDLFPSYNALFPCIGAALLIGYGNNAVTARLLCLPPVIWVGKLSYSLYIWHWPVIVFYRMVHLEFDIIDKIIVVAISFLLAIISYYYIERPFRTKSWRTKPASHVLRYGTASLATLAIMAGTITLSDKSIFYPQPVYNIAQFTTYRDMSAFTQQFRYKECFVGEDHGYESFNHESCLTVSDSKPNILLLGDSHAAHFSQALSKHFDGANVLQATASGCLPLLNTDGAATCSSLMNYTMTEFLPEHDIDMIIVSARWSNNDDISQYKATMDYLSQHTDKLVTLMSSPEYTHSLPTILARQKISNIFASTKNLRNENIQILSNKMGLIPLPANALKVNLHDALCDEACATFTPQGTPLHFDYGHFTQQGAALAVEKIKDNLVLSSNM